MKEKKRMTQRKVRRRKLNNKEQQKQKMYARAYTQHTHIHFYILSFCCPTFNVHISGVMYIITGELNGGSNIYFRQCEVGRFNANAMS